MPSIMGISCLQKDWSLYSWRNAVVLGRIKPKLHEIAANRMPLLPCKSLSIESQNNQGKMPQMQQQGFLQQLSAALELKQQWYMWESRLQSQSRSSKQLPSR